MASPTIQSIGASGCDYTTPQAWYDAHDGNITADANAPYIGEMKAETFTPIKMTGSTTDATHYFHLRAQSGAEFKGDFAGSYPLIQNAATVNNIACHADDAYARMEHFVAGNRTVGGDGFLYGIYASNATCLIAKCGAWKISITDAGLGNNTAYGIYIHSVGTDNCIVRNCAVGGISAVTSKSAVTATSYGITAAGTTVVQIYNCSVYDVDAKHTSTTATGTATAAGIIVGNSANLTVKNNIVGDVTASIAYAGGTATATDFVYGGTSPDDDYNASEDNSADDGGGTHCVLGITPSNEFEDTTLATLDLHLKRGASCEGKALDISAATGGMPDDIEDKTRCDSWDIGCHELFRRRVILTS